MAVQYQGDEGRVYVSISLDGQTLSPLPGETYEIEDPGDGRWVSVSTSEGTKTKLAMADPKSDQNAVEGSTDAVEGI